jgi:uncharacterized phosphosugar-binding protein
LLIQLGKLEAVLPDITRATDIAAEKLSSGGNLYAAGEDAFTVEAEGRGGGMMMLERLTEKTKLTAQDVVLVGVETNQDAAALAACRRARETGAHVVLFSPAFEEPPPPLAALCNVHIDNFASSAVVPGVARWRTPPTSSVFNVTALWTYTAELVGSLTRRGKIPVMFQSVLVPGGRERNAKYNGVAFADQPARRRFHDDMTVPPQAEGRLGRAYLDALRRQVSGLRGATLDQLGTVATMMAHRALAGGSAHFQTISHFTTYEVRKPGLPPWIKTAYEDWREFGPERLAGQMKPGDVFLELGYYDLRSAHVAAVQQAGAKYMAALCHAPVAPLTSAQPDMLIDAQWEYGDAAVTLPGYDIRILPTSAVLQAAIFWTVVARAEELAAQ